MEEDSEILAALTGERVGALRAFEDGFHAGWAGVKCPSVRELGRTYADAGVYVRAHRAGRKAFLETGG